jgi:hypothetical protein
MWKIFDWKCIATKEKKTTSLSSFFVESTENEKNDKLGMNLACKGLFYVHKKI